MFGHSVSAIKALALTTAVGLALGLPVYAGHGGGHGGGGHGGGGHGGGSHSGGAAFHGGPHNGGGYHHGSGYYHRGYGYGSGYPFYLGVGVGPYGYNYYPYSYYGSGRSTFFGPPDIYANGEGVPSEVRSFYPPDAAVNVAAPVATVRLYVPADAQVWFDGSATKQTGSGRAFTSPPLEPGKTYSYDVKAQWIEDGKTVVKTRTVTVQAGRTTEVDMRTTD